MENDDVQSDSVLVAGTCPLLAKLLGTFQDEHHQIGCVGCIQHCWNSFQIQALITNNGIRPLLVVVLALGGYLRQKESARAIATSTQSNPLSDCFSFQATLALPGFHGAIARFDTRAPWTLRRNRFNQVLLLLSVSYRFVIIECLFLWARASLTTH